MFLRKQIVRPFLVRSFPQDFHLNWKSRQDIFFITSACFKYFWEMLILHCIAFNKLQVEQTERFAWPPAVIQSDSQAYKIYDRGFRINNEDAQCIAIAQSTPILIIGKIKYERKLEGHLSRLRADMVLMNGMRWLFFQLWLFHWVHITIWATTEAASL